MAKRDSSYGKRSIDDIEEAYEYDDEEVVEETTKDVYTKLRCLIGHVKATGSVSGKQYEWAKAGAVVDVLIEDVPDMLKKRLGGKSCCGARSDGNFIFELIEE